VGARPELEQDRGEVQTLDRVPHCGAFDRQLLHRRGDEHANALVGREDRGAHRWLPAAPVPPSISRHSARGKRAACPGPGCEHSKHVTRVHLDGALVGQPLRGDSLLSSMTQRRSNASPLQEAAALPRRGDSRLG